MATVEEVRSELGSDSVLELMDAYYSSGLSLRDLKELFGIPSHFTDMEIVSLFPLIALDDKCPLCGSTLYAAHLSRGNEGATASSYRSSSVQCLCCGKKLDAINLEYGEIQRRNSIRRTYSAKPSEFDWNTYDSNSTGDVFFELLVYTFGIQNNAYLIPFEQSPFLSGFFDLCRNLYRKDLIEPSAAFDKWLDGFEVADDDISFYWLRVPFAIDLVNYRPVQRNKVVVINGGEYIEIGQGEYDLWKRMAKGFVMRYLDSQMESVGYESEGPKRDEFETLLETMLLTYSPAQLTSLIWSAMAVASKQADEGPSYKRKASWALGVVVNRAKNALAKGWGIHPNMPTCEIELTPFDSHFFDVHVPLGETWVYRPVPAYKGGMVHVAEATLPKDGVAATASMIAEARDIAYRAGLDEPDYLSYDETAAFVDAHLNT